MRVPLSFVFIFVLLSWSTVQGTIYWPCQVNADGYYYDLRPGNENPNSPDGLWHTSDKYNDYYFKLCEPTRTPPGGVGACESDTQVCMQDYFKNDYSLGTNPRNSGYGTPGTGVVMYSTNGYEVGCEDEEEGRQTYLQVLCPTDGYPSGSFGPVSETGPCVKTIPFYHDVGCPVTGGPLNPSLISLYQSTNGQYWKNNTNWLSEQDPTGCSWFGVACSDDPDDFDAIVGLDLPNNNLSGTLPSDFGSLDKLHFIGLQNNSLTGPIPDISSYELQFLGLSNNSFSGTFPKLSCPGLHILDLHLNKLSGVVPSHICKIFQFNIADNDWECPLPDCCYEPSPYYYCGDCHSP